ncbi:hypothetical protein OUZ56_000569 [Daphnia magna]|uniref:Uncharacterized protein n=1 Tax=Daphnia magna TaxID=35525 RepID=A0ABR0A057_9CRUS|nr:hypothetical protein OUZ56_000569 [Daphnia magna]
MEYNSFRSLNTTGADTRSDKTEDQSTRQRASASPFFAMHVAPVLFQTNHLLADVQDSSASASVSQFQIFCFVTQPPKSGGGYNFVR